MPRSKKNSKQNLPLDLQAQLHKKTWVKEERIPNVPVHNLRLREKDRKLFIFTHGRGAFAADLDFMENPFVSTPEPEKLSLEVFPNPTTDFIKVGIDGDFRYFIYNSNGQLLKQGRTRQQIDIRNFSPGQYFLEVRQDALVRKQVIVKR